MQSVISKAYETRKHGRLRRYSRSIQYPLLQFVQLDAGLILIHPLMETNTRNKIIDKDWLLHNFSVLLFERDTRFYYLAWQATLLSDGAVIRVFGRKGVWQRSIVNPYPTLVDALPLLQTLIRRRINHGYHLTTTVS